MNIDKYRMSGIEFNGNEWEFIYSLVFLRYGKKINILELGEGNYSLLYALCGEHSESIKKILSIDSKNSFQTGNKFFYEKKRIFSALANRGYYYVEHFQGDCLDNEIISIANVLFVDDPVDLVVLEYMKDDEYMDKILFTYDFFLKENVDIYYHNLKKSEQSIKYFEKISSGKRHVILDNGNGIGIIKLSNE